MWASILIASFGTYAEKLLGYLLPGHMLERESVRRMTGLLPVSLLAALVAVQTFAVDQALAIDARLFGLGVAVVALLLRAPFLVVIIVAAASTAFVRWLGWLP
jgi:branched-subunit amino acid transport protein